MNDPGRQLKSRVLLAAVIVAALAAIALAGNPSPYCGFCGLQLSDRYVEYENEVYHQTCFTNHVAPRCGVCGKILDEQWVVYNDTSYHQNCYDAQVALRCGHCGEKIFGQYLYDYWGNNYHPRHQSELGTCTFCGRLLSAGITGGGFTLDREHKICTDCSHQSIRNEDVGRRIMNDVRTRLEAYGVVINHDEIGFELVSAEILAELSGRERGNHFGLTRFRQESSFLGLLQERTFTIYLLRGQPESYFIGSVAHELMHVWQFLNTPEAGEDALVEGSCNYASLLLLREIDDNMAAYVIRGLRDDPDPAYGDGYRRVKKLVANRGLDYWLKHLQFDPEFPIGY